MARGTAVINRRMHEESVMRRALIALILAMPVAPALSAGPALPAYYPETYERIGVFNGINRNENFMVIGDVAVPLGSSPQVATPHTQFQTLRYLRPGMIVGIEARQDRREPVTAIWVMP